MSSGAQNFNFPVESATGEIYCLDYLSNGPVVLHYSKGTWNIVAQANTTVGTTQLYWLYQIGAAGADGSIAVLADSPNGTGVFSLNSGNAQLLLSVQSSSNVTQLAGAGSGVYDAGRMFGTPGVYRLTPGGPQQVLAAGWQLPSSGTASLLWDNIPERSSSSNPVVRQPGDNIARIVSGALQPIVTPGSRVGGDLVYWLGSAVTSPDGKNVVFSANTDGNNAFMNAHDGRVDLIGDISNHLIPVAGQTINWIDPNWSGPFAMNANQQFVAMGNTGSTTSLFLLGLTASHNQAIAATGRPSPGGPAYNWFNQAAIDAAGDVAFPSGLADGTTGLFLYKNGQVQQLLRTGSRLQGKVLSGIGTVQFAGSKLVDYVWYQNGGSAIQAFDGTAWTPVVSQGDLLASGRSIDYFFGNLAANDTGDVAYEAQTQGYASLLVRSHDGRDLLVGSAAEPLPDGSWPISFFGFNITPQGNVIFATESFSAGKLRLTLFNAAPTAP